MGVPSGRGRVRRGICSGEVKWLKVEVGEKVGEMQVQLEAPYLAD